MSVSNVWKEKTEPLTWRHFALATFWTVSVIPMCLLFLSAWLADKGDRMIGKLRRWANPVSYGKRRSR